MKYINFILHLGILLCLTNNLQAQELAPVGAIWHVTTFRDFAFIMEYRTIECTGDTIIQGKSCSIIDIPPTLNYTPIPAYMYQEDGKLFYLHTPNPNQPDSFKFNLLIDFSLEVGESWDMELWSDWGAPPGFVPDSVEILVDSISYFYFNNGMDSLRVQHVSVPSQTGKKLMVIEKVGFSQGLFPGFSSFSLGCCSGIRETRCYEDPNIGLIKFIEEDCDYTAVDEARPSRELFVSPNPAQHTVQVRFPVPVSRSSLYLYHSTGQLLQTLPVASGATMEEIDLGQYPDGLYFIQWYPQEGGLFSGKIIKRK